MGSHGVVRPAATSITVRVAPSPRSDQTLGDGVGWLGSGGRGHALRGLEHAGDRAIGEDLVDRLGEQRDMIMMHSARYLEEPPQA